MSSGLSLRVSTLSQLVSDHHHQALVLISHVSASSDRGAVTEQLVTILPPLEAGASSLLQVEDIRSEAGETEDLVIHHGQTWVQDILGNIQEETEEYLDFPVFCCDGIFWLSRVILASLKTSLSGDSCLILPDPSHVNIAPSSFHSKSM